MVPYYGDFAEDATVNIPFNTFTSDDPSASVTVTDLADGDIKVYKDGNDAEIVTDGATVLINFDSTTGNHLVTIDTSAHSDYSTGAEYAVRLNGITVDGATLNAWIGAFSIERAGGALAVAKTIKTETALIVADTGTTLENRLIAIEADTDVIDDGTSGLVKIASDVAAVLVDTGATLENRLIAIEADTNELQTDDYPTRFTAIETLINDIGSGSAGISIKAESSVETVAGAPTNTYAVTDQLDGVYHIVPDDGADDTDMYYQFDIGTTGIPIEVEWVGYAQGNNDTYLVYFYNWVTTSWDQVHALAGTPGTTEQTHAFSATIEHVGADGDVGKVRLRFLSTDGAVIATDFILCDYAIDNTTSISSILADTDELQTDDIPALIATAQADLNIITDADGTILGAAAIAAIWDATEAVTGQAHSYEYLLAWLYRRFFNKALVIDANGNIAIRNEADGADIATGNVVDNAGTTTMAAFTIL